MNKEEFEILSEKIRPKLLAVAQKFALVSGIEAEDVVQEAFAALWEMQSHAYPVKDAHALLVRMTKNICISHYRKIHLDTQSLVHDNYTGGAEATALTDEADVKAIRKIVYASLSNTQKEYLHLRNDRGLSLDEIATLTGKPKSSIKSTISSARKQILNLIKKEL